MQNIKEKKKNEKLKIHTLREETKNGPKKIKVPVQKTRVEGCHVKIKQLSAAKEDTDKKVIENETKTKMTARQPHGETTNGADIKQLHIKPEQELQATARMPS